MSVDLFDSFLKRLARSEVAMPENFEDCTASELEQLESKYGLRLPGIYRRFLSIMGRQCGWLFASEQVAVDYWTVLDLTQEVRSSLATSDPELAKRIPPDGFFILTTGGDVHLFIRCGKDQNPPVYVLNEPEHTIEVAHASVMEWLESGCEEAEEAIADGYFEALNIPRRTDMPRTPRRPKVPVEPLPYALICPGCGKRLVFQDPSGEHSRYVDYGFLYNDAGTLTLLWKTIDPTFEVMFGEQKPWDLSLEQQAAFEARLKPAPGGGRWRFANYPRCPHCREAIARPMTKSDLCLIYEGSLVLKEPGTGHGLSQALIEGAATPVNAPKSKGLPGHREVACSRCAARIPFDVPTIDDARLQNLGFLYNDAGTSTLVWAATDPSYRSMFGDRKPWELSAEQQAAFEARLKSARAGGEWRFANPARCPKCGAPISPPVTDSDLCLVYSGSVVVKDWISGSALNSVFR